LGEGYVHDERKEDPAHLVVLLASNTGEGGDTFSEGTKVMIWRQTATPRIYLLSPNRFGNPTDDVFDGSLINLMQEIRSYRTEDVGIREVSPKRIDDGLYPGRRACTKKAGWILFKTVYYIQDRTQIPKTSGVS